MPSRHLFLITSTSAALLACGSATRAATPVCQVPDSVASRAPAEAARIEFVSTLPVRGVQGELKPFGIGHLHHPAQNVDELPPDATAWLARVALPLSPAPERPASEWIVRGWLVRQAAPALPLTMHALLETGYEQPSFIALEARDDGWLRMQYSIGEDSARSAWTHRCALANSPAPLQLSQWADWFAGDDHILFLRTEAPDQLRGGPSLGAPVLVVITPDDVMEPKEIRGEWMRVSLRQPSDYCRPEVTPVITEGWMRWYSPTVGPLVYYYSRGC